MTLCENETKSHIHSMARHIELFDISANASEDQQSDTAKVSEEEHPLVEDTFKNSETRNQGYPISIIRTRTTSIIVHDLATIRYYISTRITITPIKSPPSELPPYVYHIDHFTASKQLNSFQINFAILTLTALFHISKQFTQQFPFFPQILLSNFAQKFSSIINFH